MGKTTAFDFKNFGIKPEKLVKEELDLVFPQELVLTRTTRSNLDKILYPLMERRNILLVGDAGIGKNALVYYVNRNRNLPTIRFSFNQDTLPEDLVGSFRILPDGFHWQDGPLAEAMINGYTFVADEMNLASPEILKRFTSVLEQRSLSMLEKDGTIITAHPRFNFIATQNPTRGFEGRKILPESIRKLFTTVYFDNYPHEEEVEIIRGLYPASSAELVEKTVNLQRNLEELVWNDKLGKEDLEHYHFNIRTAQRFWNRLKKIKNINDESPEFIENLFFSYVDVFQREKDREKALTIISEIFKFDIETLSERLKYHHSYDPNYIPAALPNPGASNSQLDPFPLTRNRLRLMEFLQEGLQFEENILLEGPESVRMAELVKALADSHGKTVRWITLAKGMHTSEIIGALRPSGGAITGSSSVRWIDGPLTDAIRKEEWVILDNIEAAGSELIEKLNMLLDHASTLTLPPEAEGHRAVKKKGETRIIGIKRYRRSRNQSTVSRAFRNRFFTLHISEVDTENELIESAAILWEACFGELDEAGDKEQIQGPQALLVKMVQFHRMINEAAMNKKIGLSLAEYVKYLEENLLRWIGHIEHWLTEEDGILKKLLASGVEVHYLSSLPEESDREFGRRLWQRIFQDLPLDDLQKKINSGKKLIQNQLQKKNLYWDPDKHKRLPLTGKAKPSLSGNPLKKGLKIDTPETGGQIKEGPDAWYGQDTEGNKGRGEPGGGGGGWGYKTEELFQQFLKKYKPRFDYDMGFELKDFYDIFGKMLQDLEMDLENALDSNTNIERRVSSLGSRVEPRKYIAYMANRGSDRIFDQSRIIHTEDKLKGLEFAFYINKGRRLFNFQSSIASVVGLQSALEVLWDKKIPSRVYGYSDLDNMKRKIDLVEYTSGFAWDMPDLKQKEEVFKYMTDNWEGDTVEEYLALRNLSDQFSPEATTRVVIILSDFRGHRARQNMEDEALKQEFQLLKEMIHDYSRQNYIFLGIQTGTRNLAEHLFNHSIWIHDENFDKAPVLIADIIQKIILQYHQPGF